MLIQFMFWMQYLYTNDVCICERIQKLCFFDLHMYLYALCAKTIQVHFCIRSLVLSSTHSSVRNDLISEVTVHIFSIHMHTFHISFMASLFDTSCGVHVCVVCWCSTTFSYSHITLYPDTMKSHLTLKSLQYKCLGLDELPYQYNSGVIITYTKIAMS